MRFWRESAFASDDKHKPNLARFSQVVLSTNAISHERAYIFWRVSALACLLTGAVQNLLAASRILHIVTLANKMDMQPATITAGSSMLYLFFSGSIGAWILAILTSRHLGPNEMYRKAAKLAGNMLAAGTLIWAALVLSPVVVVIQR